MSLLIIGRMAAARLTTQLEEGCSRNRQTAPGPSECLRRPSLRRVRNGCFRHKNIGTGRVQTSRIGSPIVTCVDLGHSTDAFPGRVGWLSCDDLPTFQHTSPASPSAKVLHATAADDPLHSHDPHGRRIGRRRADHASWPRGNGEGHVAPLRAGAAQADTRLLDAGG